MAVVLGAKGIGHSQIGRKGVISTMYDWKMQKQLIRDKLERCFDEIERCCASELNIEITVELDRPPEVEHRIREYLTTTQEKDEPKNE